MSKILSIYIHSGLFFFAEGANWARVSRECLCVKAGREGWRGERGKNLLQRGQIEPESAGYVCVCVGGGGGGRGGGGWGITLWVIKWGCANTTIRQIMIPWTKFLLIGDPVQDRTPNIWPYSRGGLFHLTADNRSNGNGPASKDSPKSPENKYPVEDTDTQTVYPV